MRELKFLFVLVVVAGWAGIGNASITDVDILPEVPTTFDVITIFTEGLSGSGPVEIGDTNFTMNGTNLELDIEVHAGFLTVMTPWVHSENIGPLPLGIYDLTVNAIYAPDVTDTFTTSFEVVPEPTTLLLLLGGIPVLRKRNR